jgi:3-oxoacyl-[acyl-carrier-protein] synthase-3
VSTLEHPRPGRTAVLAGLGSWLPPRVVTNDELAAGLDTSDEWIRTRTGIRQRHVIDPGMSTSTLAVEAGLRALKSAALAGPGTDVDAVVLATTTPDHSCPATAPEVASRLGLPGLPAFDVGAVCAGFTYALATATGLICAGIAARVLVIGADTMTTIVDRQDRATAAIFGDGAGAVVLRAGAPDEPGAFGPFDLGSDGALVDIVNVPASGRYLAMRGQAVFRNAVERMAASSLRALDAAGWSVAEVDRFACHQANSRILATLVHQLGLPAQRALANIDRVGNTAAASIPLLLADAVLAGELRPGDQVLISSFGAGLAWASTTLRWPAIAIS